MEALETKSTIFAHTPNADGKWHDLGDHLSAVAAKAEKFAEGFSAGELAVVAGLLHDLGKFHPQFQEYLLLCNERAIKGERPPKSKTPHSVCGAAYAASLNNVLALPILGHHGGLPDLSALKSRMQSEDTKRLMEKVIPKANAFLQSRSLSLYMPEWLSDPLSCEMFMRMLFSALVDADWLDTESHFDSGKSLKRRSASSPQELWEIFDAKQRSFMQTTGNDSLVNSIRREIYDSCISSADGPQGVYRLTVPTGGGKTRSGMAFALRHAVKHGLDRVIFAIPYTSIIDQTADVYRGIFGDGNVLEHHSQIDYPENMSEEESEAELRRQLAAENWDAPIIVTTTVQLFESLFGNKTSRCRKLHNIARSVIVLDEVQTLPVGLLTPILNVLKELADHYGVTVVLSTATQPAFSGESPYLKGFKPEPFEIVPDPGRYFDALKRVDYEVADEPWSWERVADEMRKHDQALCVLNSRKDALTLFGALGDSNALHLSTLLCPAHRRVVLSEIRRRLSEGEPCRVVSTQVVEAGVDLDFPVVLRAMGPLDRIVQAAGRCNREGMLPGLGKVLIFEPEDGSMPKGPYAAAVSEARIILSESDVNLHEPSVFDRFFRRLWQDCNLDTGKIQENRERLNYRYVGDTFKMIDEATVPIVVRYGDPGPMPILDRIPFKNGVSREDWRQLQSYTVSVFRYSFDKYMKEGLITQVADGLYLWIGSYDDSTGMIPGLPDPANLIA